MQSCGAFFQRARRRTVLTTRTTTHRRLATHDEEEPDCDGSASVSQLTRKVELHEERDPAARIPVVYMIDDFGTFTAEVTLSEASTVRELVVTVLRLGRAQVGAKLTPVNAVVHFVTDEGAQPARITQLTRWEDLQRASALTVTTL